MGWFILAAAYLAVALGVFVWFIRGHGTVQTKRSARAQALFPELCLFWPVAVIVKIKRREVSQDGL
ncbi:MAG: hypothetical protein ACYTAS_14515 [Planctomycetota bacterium]|jgi:hypothetical protein